MEKTRILNDNHSNLRQKEANPGRGGRRLCMMNKPEPGFFIKISPRLWLALLWLAEPALQFHERRSIQN
jgi:hypothetical protein